MSAWDMVAFTLNDAESTEFRFWPHQLEAIIAGVRAALQESRQKKYGILYDCIFPVCMSRVDLQFVLDWIMQEYEEYAFRSRESWAQFEAVMLQTQETTSLPTMPAPDGVQ
jgi:hypothetical protein